MKNLTQSPWFSLADLALALLCALGWAYAPQWGWVILAISLLPWALRLLAGKFPFRRTSLDLPIAIFLLTAGVGIWAAYDPVASWTKFWWIVAAARVFYALAGQPTGQRKQAAFLLLGIAALLSLQFLLTFDWQAHPLMGPIDRIGATWMSIRPALPLPVPEPDFIGGLTAMLTPLVLVMSIDAFQSGHKRDLGILLTLGFFLALGLLMSAERPAWLGLILAAGLWLSWQVCCWLAQRTGWSPKIIAGGGLALLSLLGIFGGMLVWQRYAGYGSVPGRLEEIVNGAHLALEYPIIGGGLSATSGLYSRYMLGIPYLFIPNIRNQYLNISIEQGLLGLAALALIFVGALFRLYRSTPPHETSSESLAPYKWALALGIIILGWHSLMEDVFYSNWGLILLFVFPGLATNLGASSRSLAISKKWWGMAVGLAAISLIIFSRPILGLWQANLGAVEMARVELANWPDELLAGEKLLSLIEPAETRFEQALESAPAQPTAHYRLGLIATERRDFEIANQHLQTAFQQRPYHRGIRKALGYSFAWIGEVEAAGETLSSIPEAAYEFSIYAQWWASEGRTDLSNYATQTENWLEAK